MNIYYNLSFQKRILILFWIITQTFLKKFSTVLKNLKYQKSTYELCPSIPNIYSSSKCLFASVNRQSWYESSRNRCSIGVVFPLFFTSFSTLASLPLRDPPTPFLTPRCPLRGWRKLLFHPREQVSRLGGFNIKNGKFYPRGSMDKNEGRGAALLTKSKCA